MAENFICSICHKEHSIEERTIFDGQELCRNCLQAETCVCTRCGERIWLNDACCDESLTLCQDCEEN